MLFVLADDSGPLIPPLGTLWPTLGWLVLCAGSVLLLWALFFDRSRGRLRCPKCWYDMAGASRSERGGWCCPECGSDVKKEKQLRRTRRRWRWALLAAAVMLAAYPVRVVPWLNGSDWPNAVPTWAVAVLAAMPGDEDAAEWRQVLRAEFSTYYSRRPAWGASLYTGMIRLRDPRYLRPGYTDRDAELLARLRKTHVVLDFRGSSIEQVMNEFGSQIGAEVVVVHHEELMRKEAEAAASYINEHSGTAWEVLDDLNWYVFQFGTRGYYEWDVEDGVVVIGPPGHFEPRLTLRLERARDLIRPAPGSDAASFESWANEEWGAYQLMDLISVRSMETWRENGGALGTIYGYGYEPTVLMITTLRRVQWDVDQMFARYNDVLDISDDESFESFIAEMCVIDPAVPVERVYTTGHVEDLFSDHYGDAQYHLLDYIEHCVQGVWWDLAKPGDEKPSTTVWALHGRLIVTDLPCVHIEIVRELRRLAEAESTEE